MRILLAKDAISTGWDCPRAEVMVSFRSATDKTHFLYSHEAFAMVENPHIRNDFRLPKRAGC